MIVKGTYNWKLLNKNIMFEKVIYMKNLNEFELIIYM